MEHENNGPPLIFVHAFPLCHRMWDKQAEYFKKNYRVVLYDNRGLGYSTEIDSWQYMMENLGEDLLSVMDFLKIDKANVCGLSMGGYITLRALTKSPERFSSVILADTRAEKDDDKGLIGRANMFNEVRKDGIDKLIKEFPEKLLGIESYKNDELRGFIEEMISWQSPEGICGALIAMATRTTTIDDLRQLNIPAQIIVGSEDGLTPLAFSEKMQEAIPDSKLNVILDAGHMTNMEKPDEFNSIIENFLKKHNNQK